MSLRSAQTVTAAEPQLGHLAEGGPLSTLGLFLTRLGARKAHHSHTTHLRAPDNPEFDCPLWPECGCPDGTMHPDCPGLKDKAGKQ